MTFVIKGHRTVSMSILDIKTVALSAHIKQGQIAVTDTGAAYYIARRHFDDLQDMAFYLVAPAANVETIEISPRNLYNPLTNSLETIVTDAEVYMNKAFIIMDDPDSPVKITAAMDVTDELQEAFCAQINELAHPTRAGETAVKLFYRQADQIAYHANKQSSPLQQKSEAAPAKTEPAEPAKPKTENPAAIKEPFGVIADPQPMTESGQPCAKSATPAVKTAEAKPQAPTVNALPKTPAASGLNDSSTEELQSPRSIAETFHDQTPLAVLATQGALSQLTRNMLQEITPDLGSLRQAWNQDPEFIRNIFGLTSGKGQIYNTVKEELEALFSQPQTSQP